MNLEAIAVIVFIIVAWLALVLMCIHADAKWAAEQEWEHDRN